MGSLQPGSVVLALFPYSDLSRHKLRPALVLAVAEFDDLILCQITSKSYTSRIAIKISSKSFARGSIVVDSFVRPDKIFTTSSKLIANELGVLSKVQFSKIMTSVRKLFNEGSGDNR